MLATEAECSRDCINTRAHTRSALQTRVRLFLTWKELSRVQMVAEQTVFDLPAHHHLILLLLLQLLLLALLPPQTTRFLSLQLQAASPALDLCSNYTTSSAARFKNVWEMLEAIGDKTGKQWCAGGGGATFKPSCLSA